MHKFKSFLLFILLSATAIFIVGCQQKKPANEIQIGTIAGPETQLMEAAKKYAAQKYHINIVIVPFTDYTMPNQALSTGDIDANMFQTIAFLNADVKAHNYKLAIVGKTFIYPMALYSKKITTIADVPMNGVVAIPNDPSNQARALLLLQGAGLITLKPGAGALATPLDVVNNPRNLQIKSLDAAELPRVLPDVTIAAINTNYAIPAGLFPSKNGLFVEKKDSPYANVVVVRAGEEDEQKYQNLMDSLHSQAVLSAAKVLFKGQAIAAW